MRTRAKLARVLYPSMFLAVDYMRDCVCVRVRV